MFKSKIFYKCMVASFLAFSGTVQASSTVSFDYGTLLSASSGYSAPNNFSSDPFAHLDVTNGGSGIWTFTLTINNNLFSSFGSKSYIGDMRFNVDPNVNWKNITSTFVSSDVGGVTSVVTNSGNCTGGTGIGCFDFGTKFGAGAGNRLSQNDYVTWTVQSFAQDTNLLNSYIHVQGITGGYSAKYTPLSAVPEPATYVMLLAGLGLVGFIASRRKSQNSRTYPKFCV